MGGIRGVEKGVVMYGMWGSTRSCISWRRFPFFSVLFSGASSGVGGGEHGHVELNLVEWEGEA